MKVILPFVAVVLLYAAMRLLFLDHEYHTDERHWVGRSLNFYRALRTGELEHTYQMEHPGVMTMWAGAIAYYIKYPFIYTHLNANFHIPSTYGVDYWKWGLNPPEMMVTLRVVKILLQTVFFALAIRFLIPLVGKPVTLIFGTLLALNTAIFRFDSWIHIDGLATIAAFAGLTAIAYAGEQTKLFETNEKRVRWLWFLAGAICATSWLNRITFLFLAIAVVLVFVVQIVSQRESIKDNSRTFREIARAAISYGLMWLAGGIATSLLLFPALWINPVEVIRAVVGLPISGALGNGPDNFFAETRNDPWNFYPIQVFRHTTLFEWVVLLALALFAYVAWKRNYVPRSALRLLPVLIVFAIFYVIGLSLSPKKAPQYAMIVFPVITLAASVGLWITVRFVTEQWQRVGKTIGVAICTIVLAYSSILMVHSLPYKNIYNNPVALSVMGESRVFAPFPAIHKVMDYIDENNPNGAETVYGSSSPYLTWAPSEYLIGPDTRPTFVLYDGLETPSDWFEIDYHIVGENYLSHLSNPHYSPAEPVFRARLDNRILYEIYPGQSIPPPSSILTNSACRWQFGDSTALYQIAVYGESIDMYFLSGRGKNVTVEVYATMNGQQEFLGRNDLTPAAPDTMIRASVPFPGGRSVYPSSAIPLTIYMYDTDSGNLLATTNSWEGWDRLTGDRADVNSNCFSQPVPSASAFRGD